MLPSVMIAYPARDKQRRPSLTSMRHRQRATPLATTHAAALPKSKPVNLESRAMCALRISK